MGSDPNGERRGSLTDALRDGLEVRRADQDRTLDAVQRLEAALGTAAPGRTTAWRADVGAALAVLAAAARDEQLDASRADSLISDIARTQPWLRNRVRGLRVSYQQLRDRIDALSAELEDGGHEPDVDDVRRRIAWLLTAIRHQRARESDLVYEAYYEAFRTDVETDATTAPSTPPEGGETS
jgi:hypothetical protein